MNSAEFIPPDTIRVKCADKCGDSDFRKHRSGWYMQSIRDALDLLAYETFFDQDRYDDLKIPESRIVMLPKGVYSVKNVYVFSGTCRPSDAVNVYWKTGFNNRPDGETYTAPRMESIAGWSDPFMPSLTGSLVGGDTSFSTVSALRFNYDTQFTAPTLPLDNIRLTKNSNFIDSGVLTYQSEVDGFFETHGWTKTGAYKYKNYGTSDVYATPFTIRHGTVYTTVAITYVSYVNDVGNVIEDETAFLGPSWANIIQTDEGVKMLLSKSCSSHTTVRVEYYGTFGSFEEVPCIPRYIRDAVEDFVCMEHGKWLIAMNESPNFLSVYKDAFDNRINGSFYRAMDRVQGLSEWERKSLGIYLSKGNY